MNDDGFANTIVPDPNDHANLLPGRVLRERYKLERRIGIGGMGAVYDVVDLRTRRHFALKVLRRELAVRGDLLRRFKSEAWAAASINHPGVVGVTDLDNEGDLHFIVMEKLDGEELATRIEKAGVLDPVFAAKVVGDVADAIAAAHGQNPKIIHRDLKPQNIFLARQGVSVDVVKVLDFGIAKLVDSDPGAQSMTSTQEIYGTPLFMSPEQLLSTKDVDERTDVYAMGIILYNALSGEFPFRAESLPEMILAANTQTPRPIREVRADVPETLAAIIARATARNREERFPSAAEMRDALRRFVASPSAVAPEREIEAPAQESRRWFLVAGGALAALGTAYAVTRAGRENPGARHEGGTASEGAKPPETAGLGDNSAAGGSGSTLGARPAADQAGISDAAAFPEGALAEPTAQPAESRPSQDKPGGRKHHTTTAKPAPAEADHEAPQLIRARTK